MSTPTLTPRQAELRELSKFFVEGTDRNPIKLTRIDSQKHLKSLRKNPEFQQHLETARKILQLLEDPDQKINVFAEGPVVLLATTNAQTLRRSIQALGESL